MDELLVDFPKAPRENEHYFGDKYEVKLRQIREKAQKAQDRAEQLQDKCPELMEMTQIHNTFRVVETLMRMQKNYSSRQSLGAGGTFLEQWTQNLETTAQYALSTRASTYILEGIYML